MSSDQTRKGLCKVIWVLGNTKIQLLLVRPRKVFRRKKKRIYVIVFQIQKTMKRLKESMKRTNYENLAFGV